MEELTGQVITLQRVSDDPYQVISGLHPIERVANLEKKLPETWIDSQSMTVTKDAVHYIRPLVQAELPAFYIDGLVRHLSLKFCE